MSKRKKQPPAPTVAETAAQRAAEAHAYVDSLTAEALAAPPPDPDAIPDVDFAPAEARRAALTSVRAALRDHLANSGSANDVLRTLDRVAEAVGGWHSL
jgi:hypothetical protein